MPVVKKKAVKKKAARKKSSKTVKLTDDDYHQVILTGDQLALMLDISREQVMRLVKFDGLPKRARGEYPLRECVEWYIHHLRDLNKAGGAQEKAKRMELIEAQKVRTQIANSIQLNELLPAGEVATVFNQVMSTVGSMLDGLAPRMAAQLAALDDPAKIQKVLFDECRDLRNTAATAVENIGLTYNSGDNTATTEDKERGSVG